MTTAIYDEFLVENTYVAWFDPATNGYAQHMPNGTWVDIDKGWEIATNGRSLEDEEDAHSTAAFLVERDNRREAAKRREC